MTHLLGMMIKKSMKNSTFPDRSRSRRREVYSVGRFRFLHIARSWVARELLVVICLVDTIFFQGEIKDESCS